MHILLMVGGNMPNPLKNLDDDMNKALGPALAAEYESLLTKQDLRGDLAVRSYLDKLIPRYEVVKSSRPGQALLGRKNQSLKLLQKHVCEMSLLSCVKEDELADKLRSVDIKKDDIEKIVKAMGQPEEVILGVLAAIGGIAISAAIVSAVCRR